MFLHPQETPVTDPIGEMLTTALAAVSAATTSAELAEVEIQFLGRNKGLNELKREIAKLPKEERPAFGARINEAAAVVEAEIDKRKVSLKSFELDERLRREAIDVSLRVFSLTFTFAFIIVPCRSAVAD